MKRALFSPSVTLADAGPAGGPNPEYAPITPDAWVARGSGYELVEKEQFRDVVGHFTTGVAIITARQDDVLYGATVSAFASVSLSPPTLLVCLNRALGTQAAVHATGAFAVNILECGQADLARRFATRGIEKFRDVRTVRGVRGAPLIEDALAHLECDVTDEAVGGTHRVFFGQVLAARCKDGEPLSYYRGKFGVFTSSPQIVNPATGPIRKRQ